MKVAAHVLAYDVDRTINHMLRNVAPWIDKIYLAYPPRPWNYTPSSREERTNPTKLESIDLSICGGRIEVVQGDWKLDEDTRNDCFDRAKAEGFDWFIVQDADEFYTQDSWNQLYAFLKSDPPLAAYKTTWYNFWKSSQFCLLDHNYSIKSTNAAFALRCLPEVKFVRARSPNVKSIGVLDHPCYHYSYVLTDEEAYNKCTSWSHSHQFDGPTWYKLKWANWSLDTRFLNPVYPTSWPRAVRFPLHQPDFAEPFSSFFEPDSKPRTFDERLYDLRAQTRNFIKQIRR